MSHVQGWSVYVGKKFLGSVYGEYNAALDNAAKEWPHYCKSEFALENHELRCKLDDIDRQVHEHSYWSGEALGMKPLSSYIPSEQLRSKLISKLKF
jgi:hypothetical protein